MGKVMLFHRCNPFCRGAGNDGRFVNIAKQRHADFTGAVIDDSANLFHPCVIDNKINWHIHTQTHYHVKLQPVMAAITCADLECNREICRYVAIGAIHDFMHGDWRIFPSNTGENSNTILGLMKTTASNYWSHPIVVPAL